MAPANGVNAAFESTRGTSRRSVRARRRPSPSTAVALALPRRSLGSRGDRNSAASLLPQRHSHVLALELKRLRDVVADTNGQRLAKGALVPVAREVQLQRLRLQAKPPGGVLDRHHIHVRLPRDRTD